MNHFGAIVLATQISKASEVTLLGGINQLPYIDRSNLFPLVYTRPDKYLFTNIEEMLCSHRYPMDIAYALSDFYEGIYSSKLHTRSLALK